MSEDSIDEKILALLNYQLNMLELKKEKTISELLQKDIIPHFPKITSMLFEDDVEYLIRAGITDADGNLLPLGKGYLANLITKD